MKRRSFLAGALALTAYAITPKIIRPDLLPRIVGDGLNDDAPGLNAMFAGEKFICENEGIRAFEGWLQGGIFRLASPIFIKNRTGISINNVTLRLDDGVRKAITIENSAEVWISGLIAEWPSRTPSPDGLHSITLQSAV